MRLAPPAIFCAPDVDLARALAAKQSRATHAAVECLHACALFVSYLVDALSGADKRAATRPRMMALAPNPLFICAGEWRAKTRAPRRSSRPPKVSVDPRAGARLHHPEDLTVVRCVGPDMDEHEGGRIVQENTAPAYGAIIRIVLSQVSTNSGHRVMGNFVRRRPNA